MMDFSYLFGGDFFVFLGCKKIVFRSLVVKIFLLNSFVSLVNSLMIVINYCSSLSILKYGRIKTCS